MKINPLFMPDDCKLAEISYRQLWITSCVMSRHNAFLNIKYLKKSNLFAAIYFLLTVVVDCENQSPENVFNTHVEWK